MKYRRVAVIGGSGFIGRYVVQRIARKGAIVTVAGRRATAAGFLRPMGDVGQIALIDAGFADEAALERALAGVDSVVISAGILHESGKQIFDLVHAKGPASVARLARQAGVRRLIHISAIGADPNSPSAYARSKAAGEAAVKAEFPDAAILRPSIVFGPEDDFFNRFAEMTRLSPLLPLIGGGYTRFQPVFVGDVADAVVAALGGSDLSDADAAGKTYELGGPEIYSFRELLELMLVETGRKRFLMPLPYRPASLMAFFFELGKFLVKPPLTRDQVTLLKRDNVVASGMPGLAELGIVPTALELILPTYLERFRRGGRFAALHTA